MSAESFKFFWTPSSSWHNCQYFSKFEPVCLLTRKFVDLYLKSVGFFTKVNAQTATYWQRIVSLSLLRGILIFEKGWFMEDITTLWKKTQEMLAQDFSPTLLKIWFSQTSIISFSRGSSATQIKLGCPNKFLTEQIKRRCGKALVTAFEKVLESRVGVELVVTMDKFAVPSNGHDDIENTSIPSSNGKAAQDNTHTFENFVVGESNKLAHSAAVAICRKPGSVYNPLFIYGATGVGKTHLLHAIAGGLAETKQGFKVAYKTTEAFTNEFVEALSTGQVRHFREKYRKLDVLLIDDVHFLSGKPSTQEEFFHTFNELFAAHHQVVLTSDRHPTEIGRLTDRIVSRFLGGLTVDIAPPELELKMAIVSKKLGALGVGFDARLCQFLAEIVNNPREIDGVVAVVSQSFQLEGEVDIATIKNLFEKKQPRLSASPKQIISAAAKFYQIKAAEITGVSRKRELVGVRQMVMFLLRNELGLSYSFIGQILGARDHTTIIHGVETFEKKLARTPVLKEELLALRKNLSL